MKIIHWLAMWVWFGFAGGAVVLLALAVPIENWMKGHAFEQIAVDNVLTAVAGGWVILAGTIAFLATRWLRTRRQAVLLHAAGLVLCGIVFLSFLRGGSGIFAGFRGGNEVIGSRFVFGPYPDAAALTRLAEEDYAGVVTLLSPLVPFEAVLLQQERDATKAAGLELIEIPMLPWVSRNEEALEKLRALATDDNDDRYYLHCYLGRHRVDLARFAILQALGVGAAAPSLVLPDRFEGGPLTVISDTVIVGPLPTKEEWFEFIVRSGTRRVISALDPANPEEQAWLAEEQLAAASAGVELLNLPVRGPEDAAVVAAAVAGSGLRTYVHGSGDTNQAGWLLAALRWDTAAAPVP